MKTAEALPQAPPRPGTDGKLLATVGKSLIIDSPLNIEKISVANGDLVEAVAINPKEVLINGRSVGETSLIVWQQGGARLVYDLTVRISPVRLEAVREQLAREFPDDDINVTYDNETAFVRGTVNDLLAAEHVMAIAGTLGRAVNLLRVKVPAEEPQILLHVKFIDVDRSASLSLGAAIATSAGNQYSGASTGLAGGPGIDNTGTFSLSNALNVFLFRKDINLGAAISALESQEPGPDAGRAQPVGVERPAGQLPLGRRVSGSHGARELQPRHRDGQLPGIRHPAEFPAAGDAARHHPAASESGSQRARLWQRRDPFGLYDSGDLQPPRPDRSGTRGWAELRHRGPDRQQFHRDVEQDSGPGRHSACSASCSPAGHGTRATPNCW